MSRSLVEGDKMAARLEAQQQRARDLFRKFGGEGDFYEVAAIIDGGNGTLVQKQLINRVREKLLPPSFLLAAQVRGMLH
ncbi:hypothetical protein A2379_03665 [Candidatus Amesbacteria bacterium RIFOXYB1_FULL_47_13]|nr:MAG: hypothetical protein A2379_03665 [Candidatus Amesbacteria bacterium RIFOXYB1_FULL_47_13]HBC73189.1 hypothetical protein [Candidatus Amesbacteria bacterium]